METVSPALIFSSSSPLYGSSSLTIITSEYHHRCPALRMAVNGHCQGKACDVGGICLDRNPETGVVAAQSPGSDGKGVDTLPYPLLQGPVALIRVFSAS